MYKILNIDILNIITEVSLTYVYNFKDWFVLCTNIQSSTKYLIVYLYIQILVQSSTEYLDYYSITHSNDMWYIV